MAAAIVFGVCRQINAVAGDVASAKITSGGSLIVQTKILIDKVRQRVTCCIAYL